MPSNPNDMRIKSYLQWCYDCDQLCETWKFDSPAYAGHAECRNVRSMGMPEFIDQVNLLFKDSSFRNYQADNSRQQSRHLNLIFIKELIDNYDMKSGNEDLEIDDKIIKFLEDEEDESTPERRKVRSAERSVESAQERADTYFNRSLRANGRGSLPTRSDMDEAIARANDRLETVVNDSDEEEDEDE